MGWLADRRAEKIERAKHNDRDFHCRYWWGDRGGEAISVFQQRCHECNPEPEKKSLIRWMLELGKGVS